jgi:hypothetical protein
VRRDYCDLTVKFSENDFADPGCNTGFSLVEVFVVVPLFDNRKSFSYANHAGGKVWRESAGRVESGFRAIVGVIRNFLVQELVQALDACIVSCGPELADALLIFLARILLAFG